MSPLQKYTLTDKKALDWANTQPTVLNYLSKLNADKARAAQDIYLFCEWSGKTPEDLLALKTDYQATEAEKLLDRFVREKVSLPDTRKWQIIMKTRGFFRANYRDLQSAAGKMEYPPAKDQGSPTKKNRRAMINACYTPRDKALVMLSSCTAMALETLSQLRWSNFEEDWTEQAVPHISLPPQLLKGHGKGKYRGVRQETFMTPEAKTVLLEYRDWFTKTFNYTWKNDDFVFLQVKRGVGKPLSRLMLAKAMLKLSKRSGTNFSVHDGRRIVQTALESVGTPSNWTKKIKGRKCSGEESPYSKPAVEQLKAKYVEALEELEFLSEGSVNRKKLEELEVKVEERNGAIAELLTNGNKKTSEIDAMKESMAILQAKFETISRFMASVYEGKATPAKNSRESGQVWAMKDAEAGKIFGLSTEEVKKEKKQPSKTQR